MDQINFAPISKDMKGCCLTDSEKTWLDQNHRVVVEFLCVQLHSVNQPEQDYLEFKKFSLVAHDEANRIGAVSTSVHLVQVIVMNDDGGWQMAFTA